MEAAKEREAFDADSPGEFDVLFGRGKGPLMHRGNQIFESEECIFLSFLRRAPVVPSQCVSLHVTFLNYSDDRRKL
jgi:hypothetical protein